MSTEIWHSKDGSVCLDAYAGPARTDGGNRTRIQFTIISEQDGSHHSTYLTAEEWREFVREIREH